MKNPTFGTNSGSRSRTEVGFPSLFSQSGFDTFGPNAKVHPRNEVGLPKSHRSLLPNRGVLGVGLATPQRSWVYGGSGLQLRWEFGLAKSHSDFAPNSLTLRAKLPTSARIFRLRTEFAHTSRKNADFGANFFSHWVGLGFGIPPSLGR